MKVPCIFLSILALFSTSAWSMGDVASGKAIYQKKCVLCHGKKGEGKKSQKAPKLAKQHDWYVYKQLVNFRSKERENAKMYPFIQNLSDQDFKDLSAYVASLK